jgi:hypothetical protein
MKKKFIYELFVMILIIITLSCKKEREENTDLTNGLVAYYAFNSNANDVSGNSHNGLVHGATLTTDKDGNDNSAYAFDGIDDYIEITNHEDISGFEEFTLCAWIFPTDFKEISSSIISKVNPNRDFQFTLSGQRIEIQFAHSGEYYYCRVEEDIIQTNTWYFLTGVWTNEGDWKIYLNGDLLKTSNQGMNKPLWTG